MSEVLDCGHLPSPHDKYTTGYGEMDSKKYCWTCCADHDRKVMEKHGKITLYLMDIDGLQGKVTNWTGYLSWPCKIRLGKHNIARVRRDVWFKVNSDVWHGVQYGDDTQICHCRKLKTVTDLAKHYSR